METRALTGVYCTSLTHYSRYKTRVVDIGGVPLGGEHPVRVQSMTTTETMDTDATVEQSIRIIEAGADYVRITAPSVKEAENLSAIKKKLRERGFKTPLIADIHFTPKAAEIAASIVEKVRINPGNYADKKKFKVFEITDKMYAEELEKIYERFAPLVKICIEHGTAMRIGTNHGSLSDRIMNRYGDTPLGMVESALEFVRICRDLNYHDIVLSMKASNPQTMVQAYRLLVKKMEDEGMNYPMHLGVTEAGEGEDGRIKSAVGICTLLEDGIGDTIRVSLTEEPEAEIPVCLRIVERYRKKTITNYELRITDTGVPHSIPYDPFSYSRRKTLETDRLGNDHVPVVILSPDAPKLTEPGSLKGMGYSYDSRLDKWNIADAAPDFVYLGDKDIPFKLPGTLKKIFNYEYWLKQEERTDSFPLFTPDDYLKAGRKSFRANFLKLKITALSSELLGAIADDRFCVIVIESENGMKSQRHFFIELIRRNIKTPVIIYKKYSGLDDENLTLYSAADAGALLTDGMGDGIWIESPSNPLSVINSVNFGILQATRTRISRTEYISCPSCGRTQFDLQKTTSMIRNRTNHLKGIKIAVMGCIVNGPGEMADADYGYVGSGPGWITLYRGKEVIKRGIPYEQALDKLIELIKEDGKWV